MNTYFQELLVMVPPTSNISGGKRARNIKERIQQWIGELKDIQKFSNDAKLFGRIYYFNHEQTRVRDIHNILKPLFDELETHLYEDDKRILQFEGIRLDMEHSDSWFELEYSLSSDEHKQRLSISELESIFTATCCLIQISELPALPSDTIRVTWL